MKIFYLFDSESGAYLREYDAQESPLQPGEYIAPTDSTDIVPDLQPGLWPVWQNGAWVNVPDHRGAVYYLADGSRHDITELGVEPPVDSSPNPFPPSLAQQRAEWLAALDHERFRRWRSGFPVVISGVTKWLHSDEFSLTQHLGLKDKARDALAAGGLMTDNITIAGNPVMWSTMDGSQVTITVQVAFDLVDAAGLQQALIFAASQVHKAAINSALELSNYDVLANWPAVFGE